jgi:hypothetical protein
MIYVIFTEEGLNSAVDEIVQDAASVWINPALSESKPKNDLSNKGISVHLLPQQTDPANEKAVVKAVEHVESQSTDKEILVEYL